MIWNAILKLLWFIFIQGPLNIIAAFSKVLEYLTGGIINDLFFHSSSNFDFSNIPMEFWWFVVIGICLFGLIFTIQMIILIFKEAMETKTKFVLTLQYSVKAFSFMFLVPIFFFLANFMIQNIANTIINNFGNGSNIAEYLYHIGDPDWDGSPTAGNGFPAPGNISNYNILVQLFGTGFMLYAVFMIGIVLVQKIIELFFLFIISPIVMIVMVLDDGKAAVVWKDMVGAKFLASTATLIGYYIFMSVTQTLLSSDMASLAYVPWAKQLFVVLFLCGGGVATMAFSDIVASFLGEAAGLREGRASFKSTISGGLAALGGAKFVGKGLKFMRNKGAKMGATGSLNNLAQSKMAGDIAGAAGLGGAGNDGSDGSGTGQDAGIGSSGGGVNTTSFRNAAANMASRTGIVGLATSAAVGATVAKMAGKPRTRNLPGIFGIPRRMRNLSQRMAATPTGARVNAFVQKRKATHKYKMQNKQKAAVKQMFKNKTNHNSHFAKQQTKYHNNIEKLKVDLMNDVTSKKDWMKKRKQLDQNVKKLNKIQDDHSKEKNKNDV